MSDEPKPLSSIKNARLRKRLSGLCAEYRDVHEEITALTTAKTALMAEISELADREKLMRVAGDGWLLTKTRGRKMLKKERLLEKGVDMAVIEYASVRGRSYYQVLERKSG